MTTYTVKNGSSIGKAFKVDGGHQVVDAGKDGEVTTTSPLSEEQIDAYAADGVKVAVKKGQPKDDSLKAEHHGGGKFRITEGEKVLLNDLSKADADAFNALSAEDKAAFVTDKTKA
jgi:hypothetical protein